MEHQEKVRQLEASREQRRLGAMVIYPVANQQGSAMAPFTFVQVAEPVALQTPGAAHGVQYKKRNSISRAA